MCLIAKVLPFGNCNNTLKLKTSACESVWLFEALRRLGVTLIIAKPNRSEKRFCSLMNPRSAVKKVCFPLNRFIKSSMNCWHFLEWSKVQRIASEELFLQRVGSPWAKVHCDVEGFFKANVLMQAAQELSTTMEVWTCCSFCCRHDDETFCIKLTPNPKVALFISKSLWTVTVVCANRSMAVAHSTTPCVNVSSVISN